MHTTRPNPLSPAAPFWLRGGLVLNAVAVAVAAWYALAPLAHGVTNVPAPTQRLVPDYDWAEWRQLPLQDGRTRPFGTFCDDALRQITGRPRFAGYESTGLVLTWVLGDRGHPDPGPWETQPFILCDHRDLRAAIYAHYAAAGAELTPEQRTGKYISPADLRASPGFDALLATVAQARQDLGAKAHFRLSPAEMKAEEVAERLARYDALRGEPLTRLAKNAIARGQYFDLAEFAAAEGVPTADARARLAAKLRPTFDPLHLAALRREPDGEWLSLTQTAMLAQAHDEEAAALLAAGSPGSGDVGQPKNDVLRAKQSAARANQAFALTQQAFRSDNLDEFAAASRSYFDVLREVSAAALQVAPTDPEAAAHYPGVATIPAELWLTAHQPFRWAWVAMLAALALLAAAGLPREAVGRSSRDGRVSWFYASALVLFLVSLGFQTEGFALRIYISGFAPVSNMYESVIFAAYVAGVLGLVLEAVYRRRVIAAAAAAVSTLGLILADQLPLALDPGISPIVPVLRTNYWLTIHVLTIVASYAAATLAWGLGNLSLGWLAFGRPPADALKMLSLYIYRALQVAVLLLATGTLLGGWWAAESWGRFWGWDPKEVGALIALLCYVVPLHARYLGWIRDFGLAVSAVVCYAAILLSWYVVNFVLAAGLHSYGFSSGGSSWVVLACLLNLEWVLAAALVWRSRVAVLAAA